MTKFTMIKNKKGGYRSKTPITYKDLNCSILKPITTLEQYKEHRSCICPLFTFTDLMFKLKINNYILFEKDNYEYPALAKLENEEPINIFSYNDEYDVYYVRDEPFTQNFKNNILYKLSYQAFKDLSFYKIYKGYYNTSLAILYEIKLMKFIYNTLFIQNESFIKKFSIKTEGGTFNNTDTVNILSICSFLNLINETIDFICSLEYNFNNDEFLPLFESIKKKKTKKIPKKKKTFASLNNLEINKTENTVT